MSAEDQYHQMRMNGMSPGGLPIEETDEEPVIDDSVKYCPDCERPNQFGELCASCLEDRRLEGLDP